MLSTYNAASSLVTFTLLLSVSVIERGRPWRMWIGVPRWEILSVTAKFAFALRFVCFKRSRRIAGIKTIPCHVSLERDRLLIPFQSQSLHPQLFLCSDFKLADNDTDQDSEWVDATTFDCYNFDSGNVHLQLTCKRHIHSDSSFGSFI